VARLLRPFWDVTLLDSAVGGQFRLSGLQLNRFKGPLVRLADFMLNEPPFRDAVQASLANKRCVLFSHVHMQHLGGG